MGNQPREPVLLSCSHNPLGETHMRYVILWLAGVPIVGIILLKVLGFI